MARAGMTCGYYRNNDRPEAFFCFLGVWSDYCPNSFMDPSAGLVCHHDQRLVVLSILISVLAAFAPRELVGRIKDLWLIEGDRPQLHRVLINLFDNACEAMPQGGSLLVWARNFIVDQHYASMTLGAKLGRYVMLRVSDTGRGTPRPVSGNIFNPSLERKGIGPGTNLGLIKSHGGFMSVYSDLGKGTTFQIFLPAKAIKDRCTPKRKRTGKMNGSLVPA